MRLFAIFLLAAMPLAGAEAPAQGGSGYPQWDGEESIEQYAQRARLPATKTLELGGV